MVVKRVMVSVTCDLACLALTQCQVSKKSRSAVSEKEKKVESFDYLV